jgi:hypothetical protein
MASFSDTFPTDGDSPGAGWTEDAGDLDVVSGTLRTQADSFADHVCIRTDTSLAADQYLRVVVSNPGSGSNFPEFYFRYTDAASPHYVLQLDANSATAEWIRRASVGGADTSIQSTNIGTGDGYVTYGITLQGTGTGTILKIWVNPVNNTPTDVNNWDSGADAADFSFTNDPASPVNSGIRVGIGGVSNIVEGCRFDNVFGGDFAGGGEPEIYAWAPVVRAVRGSTFKTVASGFTPPSDPD